MTKSMNTQPTTIEVRPEPHPIHPPVIPEPSAASVLLVGALLLFGALFYFARRRPPFDRSRGPHTNLDLDEN